MTCHACLYLQKKVQAPVAPTSSLDTSLPQYPSRQNETATSTTTTTGSNDAHAASDNAAFKGMGLERTGADEFQTYVYQLIKSRLVESVKERMKTVLCLDIPRAREVFSSSVAFEFQFHSKASAGTKVTTMPPMPSSSASLSNNSLENSSDDSRRQSTRSSIVGGVRRPSRRFSLQSKSPLELQNVFLSSGKKKSSSSSGSGGSGGSGKHVGFVATDSTIPTTENFLGAQNILLNCPILSSVLLRRFTCLFWHINRDVSMAGVCSAMMGVGRQRLLSTHGLDTTPDSSAQVFPLSIQLCSVGESGRTLYNEADSKRSASHGVIGKKAESVAENEKSEVTTEKVAPSLPSSTTVIQLRTLSKNIMPKVSNLENIGVWGGFTGETLLTEESPTNQGRVNQRLSVTAMRMKFIRQSSRVDSSAAAMFNDDVSRTIASMTAEAEILLSQLLSIPLPCDHLLLTQPVLLIDSEKGAEIACSVVRYILETGGQHLLRRKMHLVTALILEDEGVQFLKYLDDNVLKLEQLISDITDAIRDTNNAMSAQWALVDSAQEEALNMEDFQTLYENVAMATEDHASSLWEAQRIQDAIDGRFLVFAWSVEFL